MKKVNAHIPVADLKILCSIAGREGISVAGMIRRCVRYYIEFIEDGNMPQQIAKCINELQEQNKVLCEIKGVTQGLSEAIGERE